MLTQKILNLGLQAAETDSKILWGVTDFWWSLLGTMIQNYTVDQLQATDHLCELPNVPHVFHESVCHFTKVCMVVLSREHKHSMVSFPSQWSFQLTCAAGLWSVTAQSLQGQHLSTIQGSNTFFRAPAQTHHDKLNLQGFVSANLALDHIFQSYKRKAIASLVELQLGINYASGNSGHLPLKLSISQIVLSNKYRNCTRPLWDTMQKQARK